MYRFLLGSTLWILVASPAAAYTAFNCAAARMGGLMEGDTLETYYARLLDQCGCEAGSDIPICQWLESQRNKANSGHANKDIGGNLAKKAESKN